MKTVALPLLIAGTIAVASCAMAQPTDSAPVIQAPAAARFVHEPDLAQMVKPFITAQGYIDPDFSKAIAEPSPYLGDLFGNQAIADISADDIRADFVPSEAQVTAQNDHSLTLAFKDYSATFYPRSSISVKSAAVPISHVAISGSNWREIRANLASFRAMIERRGLAGKYLLRNPAYAEEQQTAAQIRSGKSAAVTVDPDLAQFDATPDAVLLMPESVHGKPEDADALIALMGKHHLDWLGLEMLSDTDQADLDAFNAARKGTPAYDKARAKLVAYFASAWNGRAGPKTSGEENYYFKLVDAAHDAGTKVFGTEGTTLAFILFRYGETPFGASVRSLIWAKNLPKKGRGAMFGGSAHFVDPPFGRFQDMVPGVRPGSTIFSLRDLTKKSG